MLLGKLNIQNRLEKTDILNEIRESERSACQKTFDKLFKRERSDDSDLDYVINMHDLRNGMSALKPENLKDYNLDSLISVLEFEQDETGMKGANFADLVSELLILDPSKGIPLTNGDDDGLKYVFDELKTPGKETIDIKRLSELYTTFAKSDSDPKYNEDQLRKMIDVISVKGEEVSYEDFRKLFMAEVF